MMCGLIGEVFRREGDVLSVNVNGVVYSVNVCNSFTCGIGEIVVLNTTLIHKEDSMTLYGFELLRDRAVFEKLLRIPGVGPSTAMLVVGTFSKEVLECVVENKVIDKLLSVKGIGRATARKILDQYKLDNGK